VGGGLRLPLRRLARRAGTLTFPPSRRIDSKIGDFHSPVLGHDRRRACRSCSVWRFSSATGKQIFQKVRNQYARDGVRLLDAVRRHEGGRPSFRSRTPTWWKRARRAVFSTPFCRGCRLTLRRTSSCSAPSIGDGVSRRRLSVAGGVHLRCCFGRSFRFSRRGSQASRELRAQREALGGPSKFLAAISACLFWSGSSQHSLPLKAWYGTTQTKYRSTPCFQIAGARPSDAKDCRGALTRTLNPYSSGVPILEV